MNDNECPVCLEPLVFDYDYLTNCCVKSICMDCFNKIKNNKCPLCNGKLRREGTISEYIKNVEEKSEKFDPKDKNIATMLLIRATHQKLIITAGLALRETNNIKHINKVYDLRKELFRLYDRFHLDHLSERDRTFVDELMKDIPPSLSRSTKKNLKSKKKSKSGKRRVRSKKK